ncbi:MAG: response regulator transcription factor [Bdellovibrio sp.]|nr:response regulator transcription factor [Bdellovibrio sp.]
MGKSTILIIEDNSDTRRFLEAMLCKEFEIIAAENAVIGIEYARTKSPDLILLDIMLPILSGYDACSLLKKDEKTKRIPIIFLSAKNTVPNITQGLTQGADDYMGKPFDYKELVARIHARLRKYDEGSPPITQIGELKIDHQNREVFYAGKKANLTLTEFDLLRYLSGNAGSIISREDILREVWKDQSKKSNDRTIDVHIRALRRKIPGLIKHLISVYGVGYKYEKN